MRRFDRLFTDRRSAAADDLAVRLLEADDPVPFDELVEDRPVAEVARWLGTGIEEGLVEDVPGGDGRRRFRLRRRGKAAVTRGRRESDRR